MDILQPIQPELLFFYYRYSISHPKNRKLKKGTP